MLLFGFTIGCMSFVPVNKIQNKSIKFKVSNSKLTTLYISTAPGIGAKEFTIEVTGADPAAIGIKVNIIFNGNAATSQEYTVPLDNGYGFVDLQTSFFIAQTSVDDTIAPTYIY